MFSVLGFAVVAGVNPFSCFPFLCIGGPVYPPRVVLLEGPIDFVQELRDGMFGFVREFIGWLDEQYG